MLCVFVTYSIKLLLLLLLLLYSRGIIGDGVWPRAVDQATVNICEFYCRYVITR